MWNALILVLVEMPKFQFIGMIQQLFLHRKKNPTRKKLFTTTTEIFEYKHKTTAINIEETHII